ncbi:hypothetical protein [Polynucleobacter sp. AP-Sving-400A-A2]|uniref:hypothetical protein n=1 Tax=Polynucleobacter sp. AP-Sving-400A-A2 TaxID=2081049 RepID=UPI001BFE2421|nr:hypothetical protein [Polynucleobacter sp. AP-Sving-400A-A2]QWE15360.1 hypothetical protein C2758_04335 [Polynucleobacter sp. AP-Sving-400A-A2]
MIKLITILYCIILMGAAVAAEPVKMSKSGICHAPNSTYYNQTKHFTTYKTLDECLKAGGKLPKK